MQPFDIQAMIERPVGYGLDLAGRLRPGVDRATAEAEIRLLAARYGALHDASPLDVTVTSTAYANHANAGGTTQTLSLLSMAGLLMLLLGCANVGNLQLARGFSRIDGLALRLALGAARGRLLRQSLVEGLLLCMVAGGASVMLAAFVLPRLLQQVWPDQADVVEVGWQSLLFASGLAAGACLLAGLLPAIATTRRAGAPRRVQRGTLRLRTALLTVQLAVSVVLLVGAGLLVRSIHHVSGAGLGVDLTGAVAVRINPPSTYTEVERESLVRTITESAERVGLPRVAGSGVAPYAGGAPWAAFLRSPDPWVRQATGTFAYVSPEYFDLIGIPLVAGRLFDTASTPADAVVSQRLARWLSPEDSALGHVFFDGDRELRVIGVVADARTVSIHHLLPAYYLFRPAAFSFMLVRNEPGAAASLRDLIRMIEPAAQPEIRPLGVELWRELRRPMVFAAGAVTVGLLGLVLAAVGTLGVFSYVVSERTREIGVRMALGANGRDILGLIVSRLAWPLACGVVIGLFGAQALGGMLGNRLYDLSPRDPIAYVAVLVTLLVAATVAIWLPARRALRVDPAVTLRAE